MMQGIQKRLIFLLWLVTVSVYGQFTIPEKPKLQTSVYDNAQLLSVPQKQKLEQKLISYADSTSTQIVVATVPTIKGEDIGLLAPRWAQKWGIGQAEKDNGVFILVAKKERKIWISPGYEAEIKLTAGIVGTITRQFILPRFKAGDYYGGLDAGTTAISQVLSGTFKNDKVPEEEFPIEIIIFLILLAVFIFIAMNSRNNSNGNNHRGGRRIRERSVADDIFETIILSGSGRSSGGFGGFGGSSGGGFGGGGFGGGFGGGGFSGGGAGGSW